MSHLTYRPEIDGLRAIAVLVVIFYHAGVRPFLGGFIGVDVFFVISGYLITSLILKDAGSGNFSFLDFWERRARRILPALLAVVLATLAAGWFIQLPVDFISLGKQAVAQSLFSSNILFFTMEGYFAPDREAIPLLHTWSLAVEEQFYLLFPIVVIFILRRNGPRLFSVLATMAGLSLAASIWAVWQAPNAAFYLLPFRAWELLAGSLLACKVWPRPSRDRVCEVAGAAGVLVIIACAILYRKHMLFPGAWAIMPCLGAVFVIWANEGGLTSSGRWLAAKPLAFIGKISYSWYLWHWPLFMMVKYFPSIDFNTPVRAALIFSSFILACLSWKYIETPFRNRTVCPTRKAMFIASLAGLIIIALTGAAIVHYKGVPSRLNAQAAQYNAGAEDINPYRYECMKYRSTEVTKDVMCETNGASGAASFLVWGDSFVDSGATAFYDLSKKYNANGYITYQHGCPPILNHTRPEWPDRAECLAYNKEVFAFIIRHKIKNVFLVGNWNAWFARDSFNFTDPEELISLQKAYSNNAQAGLQKTIDVLNKAGVTVYLVLGPPKMAFNAPRLLALQAQLSLPDKAYVSLANVQSAQKRYTDQFVAYNKENRKMLVVDPTPFFCTEGRCPAAKEGYALYYDQDHVTTHGAAVLGEALKPYFEKGF